MPMYSDIIAIVDRHNADHNSAADIANAIKDAGGTNVEVAPNDVIEATMPTATLPIIKLIEGIRYIRQHMTWQTQ